MQVILISLITWIRLYYISYSKVVQEKKAC